MARTSKQRRALKWYKITPAMIAAQAKEDDFNTALAALQDFAGEDAGDFAGAYFSDGSGDGWEIMPHDERAELLRNYVSAEYQSSRA